MPASRCDAEPNVVGRTRSTVPRLDRVRQGRQPLDPDRQGRKQLTIRARIPSRLVARRGRSTSSARPTASVAGRTARVLRLESPTSCGSGPTATGARAPVRHHQRTGDVRVARVDPRARSRPTARRSPWSPTAGPDEVDVVLQFFDLDRSHHGPGPGDPAARPPGSDLPPGREDAALRPQRARWRPGRAGHLPLGCGQEEVGTGPAADTWSRRTPRTGASSSRPSRAASATTWSSSTRDRRASSSA